jgi:hypothetical protein
MVRESKSSMRMSLLLTILMFFSRSLPRYISRTVSRILNCTIVRPQESSDCLVMRYGWQKNHEAPSTTMFI